MPSRLACLAALAAICAVAWGAVAPDRPNIVFILADDLGIECVGAYGGLSYRTPNLDKLAAGGVRFTHAFTNPLCSPTRAQVLTGRYPIHNGIKRVLFDFQKHREFLDPARETSFASLLRQAGYATAIAGKWQLSFLHERDTIRDFGFDEYQCWQIFRDGEKTSRYADPTFRQNGRVIGPELRGRYGPDVNVDFLIDFMKRHRDKPFLVYYTALLPHFPWEPTPDSGVALRAAADALGDPKYFPDMVAYLDKQVGRFLAALDELHLRERTLVVFLADNGTDRRIVSRWTDGKITRDVRGGKGTMTDAGARVPLIANWPGTIKPAVLDDLVDSSDILPTLVELAGAPAPPRAINGRSFAPRLRGQPGNGRAWVHVQNMDQRWVRNREFHLANDSTLRPVVGIGEAHAEPIPKPYSPAHQAAWDALKPGLRSAATLGK